MELVAWLRKSEKAVEVKMVEEIMSEFIWEFSSPTVIDIEETTEGVAIITGTMLAEGVSANGNLYTVDEMEDIAASAEGQPIYFGTMTRFDESLGMLKHNAHADIEPNRIGKIMKAMFNSAKRKIEYIAQIMNTDKFPDLINKVKKGWGISIQGRGLGRVLMDTAGRIVTKACGMKIKSIQLLEPDTPRGQKEAQVENVSEFQESMIFYELPHPSNLHIDVGCGSKVKVEFI